MSQKIAQICQNCGSNFERLPKERNRKYCSIDCYYEHRAKNGNRKIIKCIECGKDFYVYKYEIDRGRKYCSHKCMGKHRNNSTNSSGYFGIIDSANKAYTLGLLMADGNVHKNRLTFVSTDIELINYVAKELKYGNKIYEVDKKEYKKAYIIVITDNEICNDLSKYGIVPAKSFDDYAVAKNIPANYTQDYLLGYFDGDGSISIDKNGYCRFSMISKSEKMAHQLAEMLSKIDIKATIGIDKRSMTYRVCFYGVKNAKKFYKLYDNKLGLSRKKELVERAAKHHKH